MKKENMCACGTCIFEEKDYQEALAKAKANNPNLFVEQDK